MSVQPYHRIRAKLISAIEGSPLEPAARLLYKWATPGLASKLDRQTTAILRSVIKSTSNCVDVGAYRGEILREFCRFAPLGKHYAFEPIAHNASYLAEKFSNVRVENCALSDHVGETTFYHVIGRPARSGLRKVKYPDAHQQVEEVRVRVSTLDHMMDIDYKVDFLKIDVEGAELSVLKGSLETIRRNKPFILFEHEVSASKFYETRPENIYNLLTSSCGLSISNLGGWLLGKKPLERDEFIMRHNKGLDLYFLAHP